MLRAILSFAREVRDDVFCVSYALLECLIFSFKKEPAATSTFLFAIFAASIAYEQYSGTQQESRRVLATNLYKDYLNLAFKNPELSSPSYPQDKPAYCKIRENSRQFERYEFYVGQLVITSEEILKLTEDAEIWRDTIKSQLMYHILYLATEFDDRHTTEPVKQLIREAKIEYEKGLPMNSNWPYCNIMAYQIVPYVGHIVRYPF